MSKLVLPNRESLTVEFTSEASRPQIDDELVDNVVALANTEKRVVALGLEDNGTVTGVGREHRSVDGLSVFIFFSKTVPQVVVRAEIIHADNGLPVACIEVDRNLQIVSSIRGGRDSAV